MGRKTEGKMRIIHRYLGFFLSGIMAVYAISGIVLIFRDSDTFKVETEHKVSLKPNLEGEALAQALDMRELEGVKTKGNIISFEGGSYNSKTGKAQFITKELPYVLDKMTHLHKAKSSQPLYILNIIFGCSLLFFVISSFWMFIPSSSMFKKGMIFTAIGFVLALVLLFV
ncbi:MAG: hypothetical protein QNL61_04495 [Crocinitomicaceae bacterium]